MRMLLKILLVSLVLSSGCITTGFDYDIIPPECKEGAITKTCETSIYYDLESVEVDASEECPFGFVPVSVTQEIECFRLIDHYISELETRNKNCTP